MNTGVDEILLLPCAPFVIRDCPFVTEALKLPFSFPLVTGGNAYDFSRGLTTVVYARPGGHADLYLLNEK
jgi:hypothetical protein